MKMIFNLLWVFFLAASTYTFELPIEEKLDPDISANREAPLTELEEFKEWEIISLASQTDQISSDEPQREISPAGVEEFRRMLKGMTDISSVDDVPIEIFLQEQALMRSLLVSGAYFLKFGAITAVNLYGCLSPYCLPSLVIAISSPVVSYTQKITEGDVTNFPEIPLNYVYELFQGDPDRINFAKFPLRKRAFRFQTEGFNGFGNGYDGYAIIQDFAYGWRRVQPGEEYREISTKGGMNPLDCLVSLKEHGTLNEWLSHRFVKPNPMNLRKIGSTFKIGINSYLIYELAAPPDSLFLLVMRKPEAEYLKMHEIWKEAWRHHRAKLIAGGSNSANGT